MASQRADTHGEEEPRQRCTPMHLAAHGGGRQRLPAAVALPQRLLRRPLVVADQCSQPLNPQSHHASSALQESMPGPPKSKKAAVDEAVLWGYVPALDPRGLQRGLLQHGDPARMRRAVAKLMSGERVVVAAVGGSISVGRGSATQVRASVRHPGQHCPRCSTALKAAAMPTTFLIGGCMQSQQCPVRPGPCTPHPFPPQAVLSCLLLLAAASQNVPTRWRVASNCLPIGRCCHCCCRWVQGSDIDTDWPSYLDQFQAWLRAAFPRSRAELVNKAQSGSTSNIFDACAEAMVPKASGVRACWLAGDRGCCLVCVWLAAGLPHLPAQSCVSLPLPCMPCTAAPMPPGLPLQDADIVIVEFAMNDGTNVECARDGSGTVPARGSFERLLRKLQALPNRPAVVVLNAYSFIRGSVGSYLKVGGQTPHDLVEPAYGNFAWVVDIRLGRVALSCLPSPPLSATSQIFFHRHAER